MMHRYHPDPERNDDPDAIVWDNCADCASAARSPLAKLDDDNVRRLWDQLVAVELEDTAHYRSRAERQAVDALWPTYLLAQRNPGLYARIAAVAAERTEQARQARQ